MSSERRESRRRTMMSVGENSSQARQIDFVLAYRPKEGNANRDTDYRQEFEKKLIRQGLQLEHEGLDQSQDGRTCFVKIHAPWDVLARQAEINRMKMPIKLNDLPPERSIEWVDRFFQLIRCPNPFKLHSKSKLGIFGGRLSCRFCRTGRRPTTMGYSFDDDENIIDERDAEEPEYFTAAFSRERAHQFLITDRDTFFSPTQRIRIVWDLIVRTQFHRQPLNVQNGETLQTGFGKYKEPVGILFLLKEKIYVSAFPIHDGDCDEPNYSVTNGTTYAQVPTSPSGTQLHHPMRQYLYEYWARPKRCLTYQPLGKVRNYYGEKVAIYFAWLGFYTKMLVLPALVGLICFGYGLWNYATDIPRKDICESPGISNLTICRMCTKAVCPFKTLGSSCLYATLTVVFDNHATVVFALFMSIWAVVFLEVWKRRQAELCWDWGVTDATDFGHEEGTIRPEYQAAVKTQRVNPVTQVLEPYLPARNKIHRVLASVTSVGFMVSVVLAILAGIIFYRIVGVGLYYQMNMQKTNAQGTLLEHVGAPVVTSVTAAIINAICILVLEKLYEGLAWYLTEKECPRTEGDFETSYTYKVFVFQFINYYAALFYIAFLKGKIFDSPGGAESADSRRQQYSDRCDPAGCLIDVCIQLSIIMIGKQFVSNFAEIGLPVLQNWWRRRKNVVETEENLYTRWEKDYDLNPLPRLGLFDEYLEMIIQYGFVTMFVAAFPLAPLFALLNNIIEIRLDAYKLITQFRRPIPTSAQSIGAWYTVLELITKIAVLTNGLVIAFTSDFIDRIVYTTVNADHSLNGYIRNLFSEFSTERWPEPLRVDAVLGNVTTCYYRDYRNAPDAPTPYSRTELWWHVLVARLAFVIVFEHVVFFIQGLVAYFIPDIPEHVQIKIQRESYLAKQALYSFEFEHHGVASGTSPVENQPPTREETPETALHYPSNGNGTVKRVIQTYNENGGRRKKSSVVRSATFDASTTFDEFLFL